jgi:DNA mismatch repair protein MutL
MIRVLDAATVGRIAAGEVVERPSSIAKELIENSLDADSTSITIEIRDGGESYLRVTDNGGGIAPSQMRLAFENHATSKLRDGDDLTDIRTLGFRGEALPSIAAVAKVEMTSRVKGADTGARLRIEGGRFIEMQEAGCPEGTTIIVRDLFFNTPVRKSFLKKPSYEAGVLAEMVERLALGNPSVAVRLISGGRTLLHSFGDDSMLHAALAVYGRETASQMKPIDLSSGGLRIWGLIGVGDCARANRSGQSFFVNGRLIRCTLLTQALENACRGRVTIGMYPMCALHTVLPPTAIDVNVHPNKLEIRFRDEAGFRTSLEALFDQAFEKERMTDAPISALPKPRTKIEYTPPEAIEQTKVLYPPEKPVEKPTEVARLVAEPASQQTEGRPGQPSRSAPTPVHSPVYSGPIIRTSILHEKPSVSLSEGWLDEDDKPHTSLETDESDETPSGEAAQTAEGYRLIGVYNNTYLLVEQADSLIIIDQHAAHERILYEKYKRMLDQGTASQQLLAPLIVPVSAKERAILLDNLDLLSESGFEIDLFGERDIAVRAVPFVLSKASLSPFFMEMIEQLDQLKSATLDRRRGEIIQMSCKRAIKAGDRLSEPEIDALLMEMARTNAPPNCPHGRPVLRVFRRNEIERMFKRLQ